MRKRYRMWLPKYSKPTSKLSEAEKEQIKYTSDEFIKSQLKPKIEKFMESAKEKELVVVFKPLI